MSEKCRNCGSYLTNHDDEGRCASRSTVYEPASPSTGTAQDVSAISEAADELEAAYRAQYSDGDGGIHPALQSKFDLDMDLVHRLRALRSPADRRENVSAIIDAAKLCESEAGRTRDAKTNAHWTKVAAALRQMVGQPTAPDCDPDGEPCGECARCKARVKRIADELTPPADRERGTPDPSKENG